MKIELPTKAKIKELLIIDAQDLVDSKIEIEVYLDSDNVVPTIVYDRFGKPVQFSCNSYPRGVRKIPKRQSRPEKYLWIEHAERNAIYEMARNGVSTKGCIMCILWHPCADCARAIVQSGFSALLCSKPNMSDERWGNHFSVADSILKEGRVNVFYYEDESDGWD